MLRSKVFLSLLFFISVVCHGQPRYQKKYDAVSKKLVEEGWQENGQKIKYWKFYRKNGSRLKQGHYCKGIPCKYWYFYDQNSKKSKEGWLLDGKKHKWWKIYLNGKLTEKTQYENDQRNGFSIRYKKGKVVKALKYARGKKLNEWSDLSKFRADNPELFR